MDSELTSKYIQIQFLISDARIDSWVRSGRLCKAQGGGPETHFWTRRGVFHEDFATSVGEPPLFQTSPTPRIVFALRSRGAHGTRHAPRGRRRRRDEDPARPRCRAGTALLRKRISVPVLSLVFRWPCKRIYGLFRAFQRSAGSALRCLRFEVAEAHWKIVRRNTRGAEAVGN